MQSYSEANHPPIVAVDGRLDRSVRAGSTIELTGSANDPDDQSVHLHWWIYREAGTVEEEAVLRDLGNGSARVTIPARASVGQTLHLIPEGTDTGEPPLTRYQRVILSMH